MGHAVFSQRQFRRAVHGLLRDEKKAAIFDADIARISDVLFDDSVTKVQ
jgi:hypothetical protein